MIRIRQKNLPTLKIQIWTWTPSFKYISVSSLLNVVIYVGILSYMPIWSDLEKNVWLFQLVWSEDTNASFFSNWCAQSLSSLREVFKELRSTYMISPSMQIWLCKPTKFEISNSEHIHVTLCVYLHYSWHRNRLYSIVWQIRSTGSPCKSCLWSVEFCSLDRK